MVYTTAPLNKLPRLVRIYSDVQLSSASLPPESPHVRESAGIFRLTKPTGFIPMQRFFRTKFWERKLRVAAFAAVTFLAFC